MRARVGVGVGVGVRVRLRVRVRVRVRARARVRVRVRGRVSTFATSRWSKMSDCARSFLKSAEPASTIPATFTLSFVMNICVAVSATLRT